MSLFKSCGSEASEKVAVGKRKERHSVGSVGRGWGLKRRFRIGTVRRNKRYSVPFSLFNSRIRPSNLSVALRRTLQATMLRFARLDGSVAVEEEGTRGDAGVRG